ncbi:LOW QUALITY PROTEIN: dynein regulatory complex protein 10 [Molothrus ater]|uniref:LOW QUALITY PROTEIN: dynein regulatory complex protein 10 n=1 Tax=Molothrus ater TaxID=84834 RepID=UPI00174D3E00|nr:LOW QUALITY PROTEIN: dynein regulatory complex protein 10 [Molothrus ater]
MATGDPAAFQASMKQRTLVKGMATPRKAGIPLGVMKVLDPRQLKPDSTETERILTVLDETIVKLEITRLIPRITASLDRYGRMLGPEITRGLLELQKLSMEIQHLLTSPGDAKTMRAVEQRLKSSLRNILRLFLANPLLYHGLKFEVRVKESPADVFIKAFMEFRDFTLERLLTTPDEEREMIQFMKDISLQVEKNTEMISALQGELEGVIQTRDEEVSRKDKTIENLKTTMEDLAKNCKAEIRLIMKEGEKQKKEDEEASQERCARLKEDIQHLGTQFNALVLEHRASELVLRKEKCKAEKEIQEWVQKYDIDMTEKQTTYDELQAVYNEEKEQLSLLMEKHAMLLQEYTLIEEERRILKEKEEEAAREEARRNKAATCIQAFWKGYLVRSIYKSVLKKGKGKGKGKK